MDRNTASPSQKSPPPDKLSIRQRSGTAIRALPTPAFGRGVLAAVVAALTAVGCVDEQPVAPSRLQPRWTVATLPFDSIDDDPDALAIAREVPSFAGLYFNDRGDVEVALTNPSDLPAAAARIRSRLGTRRTEFGSVDHRTVRFVSRAVQYSFLELARYKTVLRRNGIFAIDGVVSLDVKEPENRVKIGITQSAVEGRVRTLLAQLSIPEETVVFWQTPYPSLTTHTLADSMGILQGALAIESLEWACTLGFPARRNSDWAPVFVTNFHCTEDPHRFDGGPFRQGPVNHRETIGHELVDPTTHECGIFDIDPCRNSDAALISAIVPIQLGTIARTTRSSPSGCENCIMPDTIDHANPVFQITARTGSVVENEILHKIGRSTGWTQGKVEDRCADYEMNGDLVGAPNWVIRCADRVDYTSQGGDSGGPVFSIKPDGSVDLRGINFGHTNVWHGLSEDGLMSALYRIEMDLGGLTVFDPGPPAVTITGPTVVPHGVYCSWTATVTGISPFTYQWSGMFSGSGPSVDGFVSSSGWLAVVVTDRLGRQGNNAIDVLVEGDPGPLICP